METLQNINKMIDVRKAAEIAADYLRTFFPTADKIQLEEVEISDDKKSWNITLSYSASESGGGFIVYGGSRNYKTFKIDADQGDVLAMKIKKL